MGHSPWAHKEKVTGPRIMSAAVESFKHGGMSSVRGCVLLPYVFPDKHARVYHVSEMRLKCSEVLVQ